MTNVRHSDLTDEGRAFLQVRVARFGRLTAGLLGFALVYRLGILVFSPVSIGTREEQAFLASHFAHAAGVLGLLLVWLLCRSTARSVRFVQTTESLGLLSTTIALSIMGMLIPLDARPEMVVCSLLTFVFVARSIYVPSSGLRTGLLGSVLGVPILLSIYAGYAMASPEEWAAVPLRIEGWERRDNLLFIVDVAGVYWTFSIILATAASRVIYGLRQDLREVRKLGHYHLLGKLGEGGMGLVYAAEHALLRRPTAIKLLPRGRAGDAAIARFEREVRLTAALRHPHTVTVFDYGRTPDNIFYYAMERLEGGTLQQVVDVGGAMPPARVVRVLVQVCGALAEAHDRGLVHRDIKPANIMLCNQGGIHDFSKVLDFGLVKDLDASEADAAQTLASTITGTPHYMPPEAIRAPESVGPTSDLYALGAVAYFMLTGTQVFPSASVIEACSKHLSDSPQPVSERLGEPVPPELEALVMRCLQKRSADRPQSAAELGEALAALDLQGETWSQLDARAWWEGHPMEWNSSEVSETRLQRMLEVDLAARAQTLAPDA